MFVSVCRVFKFVYNEKETDFAPDITELGAAHAPPVIVFQTCKAVKAGEELTFDYVKEPRSFAPMGIFLCRCGEKLRKNTDGSYRWCRKRLTSVPPRVIAAWPKHYPL